ncbi:MAG: Multidrug resistance protein MdtC [Phycisphaerae bacterium]|nr:Multidrug resistance protein MdtC [Phycisphaerae bacterium]
MSEHQPGPKRVPLTSRIVEVFLTGNLSAMLIIVSLIGGAFALLATPREEDPQIVVPMADVIIRTKSATTPREVEQQVAGELEKLLYEIDGVEYVYSTSYADQAVVTVRFYVGQDREASLVKIYNKLSMNLDRVPPQVASWVVKPVEIDDVPILAVTLFSDRQDDYVLRRVAEEIESRLKAVPDTGRTYVVGGRPRKLLIHVDPQAAAARGVGIDQIARALQAADVQWSAGTIDEVRKGPAGERLDEAVVEAGQVVTSVDEVRSLIVAVSGGAPVYLRDVADVQLGPDEATNYCRIGFGPRADPELIPAAFRDTGKDFPAVTVAVAKRKGTNAVTVANALLGRLKEIKQDILPDSVYYHVTRNYGQTSNDKVNELVESLGVAIVIVIALIAVTLGWREGLVVATAVPITFSLTLLVNYWAGYTINRVTLFALILALGLVVDDPIVDVENIHRHFRLRPKNPFQAVLDAVNEVRPPIILATLAVIVSFLPMFFITGMMGPYMRPMALNVPLAMLMSLLVAFTVTPWLSYHVLKRGDAHGAPEAEFRIERTLLFRAYHATLAPLLKHRGLRWAVLGATTLLFAGSCWLAADRLVPLKMLPYDNKNEFQVVLDMDEGTTLEDTEATAAEMAAWLRTQAEVTDVTSYAGLGSPMDFNGMVRHYYMRAGANVADLRVNIVHKKERVQQSHEIALRIRDELQKIADRHHASMKIVEIPPGPPVLSTVVAEVYGKPYTPYAEMIDAAETVKRRLAQEEGVVDVDSTVEARQRLWRFVPDREKARLSFVGENQIAQALSAANGGWQVAVLHDEHDVNPTMIELRLPRTDRTTVDELSAVSVTPTSGQSPVRLSELGQWKDLTREQPVYHKNLARVVYVTAEMAGRPPAEAILDIQADRTKLGSGDGGQGSEENARASSVAASGDSRSPIPDPRHLSERSFIDNGAGVAWSVPDDVTVKWNGEGEWKITLDVFRDLGIAFAAACLGIYILLVYETRSYLMPLILMISIPLTIIGIMPGFWLLNALGGVPVAGWPNPTFFTATAMIGMIALSGIAVRNAILLIEFVHKALAQGKSCTLALCESGAVRFRPIFLTAGTAMLAAWPITLDPIFSGLAWALIFGLFVSTAFTLIIIPVVYYMAYGKRHAAEAAARQAATPQK